MFSIENDIRRFEDLIDHISKGFQSLMIANGAALVACLAAFKDYASSPLYKGIGILAALFTMGLIAALFGYLFILGERMILVQRILSKKILKAPKWFATAAGTAAAISMSSFVLALGLIAIKVYTM
jgi:hypothetical protein